MYMMSYEDQQAVAMSGLNDYLNSIIHGSQLVCAL
jgi:hypothetical protein